MAHTPLTTAARDRLGRGGPVRCTILVGASSPAASQVFTGFAMLAQAQLVRATLTRASSSDVELASSAVAVVVGDGRRVVYDLHDAARLDPRGLEWSDCYFKRSYDDRVARAAGGRRVVRPLGLNYPVYCRGDWRGARMLSVLARARSDGPRRVARSIVDLSDALSWLTRSTTGRAACDVRRFEAPPDPRSEPRALMLTRTWDPVAVASDPSLAEERSRMNRSRVGCIRALRAELGARFVGGLAPTDDAIRDYPDCVVDGELTRKRRYVETMLASDVCVATAGLAGSNGWRLGEYVAASRAVVTEPLRAEVPGVFVDGRNYLSFDGPEACVERVTELLTDEERRHALMRANSAYYRDYVRPDALVSYTLAEALA